ncbi:MAG: UDP-galactopyranose mutase [Candidatus Fibromonas sp.]|jgi:UDP-galactopyranose mutase|nr:UDP-galactopyranose mutase [Candidatus Fibromonas sp.]
MKSYDYLIVGAGFFGAVFARQAKDKGKRVLIMDRRKHIGGNCYTENISGINVHKYGAHIFHTSNRDVWEFANRFAEFNRYTHQITANYRGEFYNLPFNMNTFCQLWKIKTPAEAMNKINEQRFNGEPKNLEEQALSLVGKDIYEKLIRDYTEKQWGKKATELPAFIIKRIPLRFTFDNCYYNDSYQGIPVGGYTALFENMLKGIEIRLDIDYLKNRGELDSLADNIIFTGSIDEFFDYRFGTLEYRSLRFETEIPECENFQGCAVMNYTDSETKFTRIIEHKHFEQTESAKTVITREYPANWKIGDEAYYPVNDSKNNDLYRKYSELAKTLGNIAFGGRLGMYKYYDMDDTIEQALKLAEQYHA